MPKIEEVEGGITAVPGIKASGINCGIKATQLDLALIYSEVEASCACMMSTNRIKAAPLIINRRVIRRGVAQAIIVNSGNANVLNGRQGLLDAKEMALLTATNLGIPTESVIVASTGIIGERLPMEKIRDGIPRLVKELRDDGGEDAAIAIMTTDTRKKEFAIRYHFGRKYITIGGMAKGSGMIHPKMATMLAFIATDLYILPGLLKRLLKASVDKSFNMISVDGDTSTNDLVVLLANGINTDLYIKEEGRLYYGFKEAVDYVCSRLAEMIIKDGEGATRLIRIIVKGGKTHTEAKRVAEAVATSNLVKSSIYGGDPNIGRVMAAIGRVASINQDKIDLYLNGLRVVRNGVRIEFDRIKARDLLTSKEVRLSIFLNKGEEMAEFLTCDLSPRYIEINAHYRT